MRSLLTAGAASVLVVAASLLLAHPTAARVCLPPLFEHGQRLHPLTGMQIMWLDPLLRQHEFCWRDKPREVRIALFGDSAVFGFPLPAEQTFSALVNQRLDAAGIPAHLFNLAWVFTYQMRDTVILHEALAYDPDLIVYVMTLADLTHVAPTAYPIPLVRFFELNTDALARLAAAPPAGLQEPVERYRVVADRSRWLVTADRMRQLGYLTRAASRSVAGTLARRVGAEPAAEPLPVPARKTAYDCEATLRQNALFFQDFEQWNPLEDLADIRARRGIDVLVVNGPDEPEPDGECFNRRYSKALFSEYNRWLAAETARLGLPYLDLHDLVAPENFIDSLHVTAAGHRQIADRVAPALEPLVAARLARRGSPADDRGTRQ